MKSTLMIGIGASVILVSSSMAVYFKSQANDYRLRWIEASIEAESRTPAARNRERDVAATDRSGHVTQAVTERYEQRVASLQRQISDLEVQLGQRETVWVSYPQEQTGQVEPRGRPEGEPPQRDWNDWMQNLQETDPERYQQLQERRERAQQRMQSNFAQRAAFLLDRDTSGLSESEAAEHAQLISLFTETWQLAEMARSDGLSQEDQRAVFRSVRENMRELAPLLQSERQRAITELARGIGYSDSEAANFAEYIREVYEITSSGPLFRTTGGRGGSWGGGGGGPRPQR